MKKNILAIALSGLMFSGFVLAEIPNDDLENNITARETTENQKTESATYTKYGTLTNELLESFKESYSEKYNSFYENYVNNSERIEKHIEESKDNQEELGIQEDRAFIALSSLLISDYDDLVKQVESYKEQKINQVNESTKEALETLKNDYINKDSLFYKKYIENIEKSKELRIKEEIIEQQKLDIQILKNDMEIERLKMIKEKMNSGVITHELLNRMSSTN